MGVPKSNIWPQATPSSRIGKSDWKSISADTHVLASARAPENRTSGLRQLSVRESVNLIRNRLVRTVVHRSLCFATLIYVGLCWELRAPLRNIRQCITCKAPGRPCMQTLTLSNLGSRRARHRNTCSAHPSSLHRTHNNTSLSSCSFLGCRRVIHSVA